MLGGYGGSPYLSNYRMTDDRSYLPSNIEAVRGAVDARVGDFSGLWNRMEEDERWYKLEPFTGSTAEFDDLREKNYRYYTSNEPQAYANKLKASIFTARVNFKVSAARENEEQRIHNQIKKDFLISALKMADKYLLKRLSPRLLYQLAHYATLRGWYAGRCLLRRQSNGKTIVDITPWDPKQVVWQLGPNGLAWVCHVSFMTYAEMQMWYPSMKEKFTSDELESTDRMMVYEYYDDEYHMIFTESFEIKNRTRHGAPSIPVFIGPIGGFPMTAAGAFDYGLEFVGESCYEAVRGLYATLNLIMSTRLHNVVKSARQTVIYKSRGGDKTLEVDPHEEGAEISIETDESVEAMKPAESAPETDATLAQILSEIQRGTLSHTSYGEIHHQISGYAIQLLRQNAESRVVPLIEGTQDAVQQIADLLCEQYATGRFEPIPIAGQLDEQASEMVGNADDAEVKLSANLPQDLAANAEVAMKLTAGENPLISRSYARERILEIDDEEGMQDLINAELGERIIPTALMRTLAEALMNRGQYEEAQELLLQYQIVRTQDMLQLQALMAQSQMGIAPGEPGAPPGGEVTPPEGPGEEGTDNRLAPQQVLGAPQPAPTPQAGPLVGPGTPRPGAQEG